MAKALLGHVGSMPDSRLMSEVHLLRSRAGALTDRVGTLETEVAELRAEVARLRAANAALASGLRVDDEMISLEVPSSAELAEALS